MLALPAPGAVALPPAPVPALGDNLRYFATCYVAGLVFCLIMLS